MAHLPPSLLQAVALGLLLLALRLADDPPPAPARSPAPEPSADGPCAPVCPFCGAPCDTPRVCRCGSDGHWLY